MDLQKIVRPNVLQLAAYSSARSEYSGTADMVMLDANENPYGAAYARYPDPLQAALKERLADIRDVSEEQVFVGNGSDEIIDLLIRLTCQPGQDTILTLDPSYGMYKVSAAINDVELQLVPMQEDLTVDPNALLTAISNQKLIFLCSPNNPDGSLLPTELIEEVLTRAKGLVIIDEAYIDFADQESWTTRLSDHPNLVVLQTFSKSWAAAGIRVGVGYMSVELVALLNKIKPPYNVSTPAQEAALQVLKDYDRLQEEIATIKQQRHWLSAALTALPSVRTVFPSEANFLLVRFHNAELTYQLLKDRGIVVRNRSAQTHCHNTLRITVGTPAQNKLLIQTLKQIQDG